MNYKSKDGSIRLFRGANSDVITELGLADSVDSVVTDPPYGISFMGKKWDCSVPSVETWSSVLTAIKPGGYLLSFSGTRTYHRAVVNIEDAGFEIRDMIAWAYGTGFPKSLNVGGLGTALKPALEPIVLARKPIKTTVVANIHTHGTGALNITACRVPTTDTYHYRNGAGGNGFHGGVGRPPDGSRVDTPSMPAGGRWPANIIHDGSDVGLGTASRFFYCAKPSRSERGEGNNHPTVKPIALMRYLCKLVTPCGGIILDPFMGSGTTGLAARLEAFQFLGIDNDAAAYEIAVRRLSA